MKTLKNKILNKIYTRFMEKKRAYKTSILDKILTYTPILNSFNFIGNLEAFMSLLTAYTVSLSLIIIPFANHKFLHSNASFTAIGVGIFFMLVFYTLSLTLCFKDKKIKKEKHDQEYKSKPLSIEDLNTVIDNVNKKIVSKLLKDNDQKITYGDLEKLDELLLNERESLLKIEQEEIENVWSNVDKKAIIKRFQGKDTNTMIQELESIGIPVNNGEVLVNQKIVSDNIVKKEDKKLEVLFS